MAKGHSQGAYAKTDKSPNYLGEALGIGIDVAFKNRALKTAEEDKEQERQDASDALFKRSEFKNSLGINGNLNRMQYDLAQASRLKDLELHKEYLSTQDPTRRQEILYEKSNNEGNFQQSVLFQENLAKRKADLDLGKDVYDEESLREKNELMANFALSDVYVDKVGMARFTTYDKEGNVIAKDQNYEDVLNSYVPLKKSTFENDLKASVEAVAVNTVKNDRGIFTYEDIQADKEAKEISKAVFIKQVLDDTSNKSILARQLGIDPKDNVAIAKAIDTIYETKFDETHNKGYNTAKASLEYRKKEDAEAKALAKKEKEEKEVGASDIRPHSQKKGSDKKINGVIFGIGAKTIKKDLGGGNVEVLKGFTLQRDGSIITTTMVARPKLTPNQFATLGTTKLKALGIKEGMSFSDYENLPNELEKNYSSKDKNDDGADFYTKTKGKDGKSIKNTTQLREILINNYREDFPSNESQSDAYTREELYSSGWNDSQINQAVKEGKIKVK